VQSKQVFAKLLRVKEEQYNQQLLLEYGNEYELNRGRFWRNMSKRKTQPRGWYSIKVDNESISEPDKLRSCWATYYHKLLNEDQDESRLYDNNFKCKINDLIAQIVVNDSTHIDPTGVLDLPITADEVSSACSNLPNKKAPGHDMIMYEHLKYGGTSLHLNLAILYNTILETNIIHIIPNAFKVGTLVPLYKGKGKDKHRMDSYRGITLMSVLNKLLEKIIWTRLKPWLVQHGFPHQQQFACRTGSNSLLNSYVLQDVISYHTERGSKVYTCFLDAEKAFDKIWWNGLFYKIAKMGITGKLWFLIRNWFLDSSFCLKLNFLINFL